MNYTDEQRFKALLETKRQYRILHNASNLSNYCVFDDKNWPEKYFENISDLADYIIKKD